MKKTANKSQGRRLWKSKTKQYRSGTSHLPRSLRNVLSVERLETRCLLANVSLVGNELRVEFDTADEVVSLGTSGSTVRASDVDGMIIGSFPASSVQRVVVSDPSNLNGQRLNLTGSSGFQLPGGFESTGIEFVQISSPIVVSGTSRINIDSPVSVSISQAISTVDGDIQLVGMGQSASFSDGVSISANVSTLGIGSILINGTARGSDFLQVGAAINGQITTASGDIEIIGQGGIQELPGAANPAFNYGVSVSRLIRSGGGGLVRIEGTGGGSSSGLIDRSNDHGVLVSGAGQVTSEGGAVTIIGTAGNSRDSSGVLVESGGRITSGAGGNVLVQGVGSQGVRNNTGIQVRGASSSISGGDSAEVRLHGTGGSGGAEYLGSTVIGHHGISVRQQGLITSGGGDLFVTGIGGSGEGGAIHGVEITLNGQIAPGGSGNLLLNGTGGHVNSDFQGHGVLLSGASVSSAGGNVSIWGQTNPASPTGRGSAGISGSGFSAGGLGSLLMEGSASGLDSGVAISGASTSGGNLTIQATGSPISISGVAPGGLGSLLVQATGADVITTGTITSGGGNVAFETNDGRMLIRGLITAGGNGNVRIDATGTDQGIILENFGRVSSSGGDVELIGRGNIGISVAADFSSPAISAGGDGAVHLLGIGGTTGVLLSNSRTITSSGGLVRVEGSGSSRGVHIRLAGSVNSPGKVQVVGTAGESNNSRGVLIESQGAVIAGQDLEVIGTAGTGASSGYGVQVTGTNSRIVGGASGSTAQIVGSGGSSSTSTSQRGVSIESSARIETNGSDLLIDGAIPNGQGVGVQTSGTNTQIVSPGHVQISGSGGHSGSGNTGVFLSQGPVSSVNGLVEVTGFGGAGSSTGVQVSRATLGATSLGTRINGSAGGGFGVILEGGSVVTSSSGPIEVRAETQSTQNHALRIRDGIVFASVPGASLVANGSNPIEIRADSIRIDSGAAPPQIVATEGIVSFLPQTPGTRIALGGDDVLSATDAVLGLTALELDHIFSDVLILGDVLSGAIDLNADVVRSQATDLQLRSGEQIRLNGRRINTSGGTLTLAATTGVQTLLTGADLQVGRLEFTAPTPILFQIDGTDPGVNHTVYRVDGSLDLSGGVLSLSGAWVPTANESLVLLQNDGNEPVIGHFDGLPEGALVMLAGRSMTITYLGGDGNDVALVPVAITGFDVAQGLQQRSFIRYLEVDYSTATVAEMMRTTPGRLRLVRYDMNGAGPGIAMPLGALSQAGIGGNRLMIDFGPNGITGNRNSSAGDGYYALEMDLHGNGQFEDSRRFYRLFGDTNGDRVVDQADVAAVQSRIGSVVGLSNWDINGDGRINSIDLALVRRHVGRRIGFDLWLDD